MVRPLLARLPRWGLRSWKPKPVGHVASSSESACGAIIGVVRRFSGVGNVDIILSWGIEYGSASTKVVKRRTKNPGHPTRYGVRGRKKKGKLSPYCDGAMSYL
jgi:hypothetical protein